MLGTDAQRHGGLKLPPCTRSGRKPTMANTTWVGTLLVLGRVWPSRSEDIIGSSSSRDDCPSSAALARRRLAAIGGHPGRSRHQGRSGSSIPRGRLAEP